jgi:hypothetical protein
VEALGEALGIAMVILGGVLLIALIWDSLR